MKITLKELIENIQVMGTLSLRHSLKKEIPTWQMFLFKVKTIKADFRQ